MDYIDIYFDAIENLRIAIQCDSHKYKEASIRLCGITNKETIFILSKLMIPIQLLILVFSLIIVFVKFVNFFFCKKNNKLTLAGTKLYLNFTSIFVQRLTKIDVPDEPSYWMDGPHKDGKFKIPNCCQSIKYKELVKRKELVKSLLLFGKVWICYPFKVKGIHPIYNSFDFFVVAYVLNRISGNLDLFFSNQSDRWALLFDKVQSKSKTLLQHGVDIDYGEKFNKLYNITNFYSISKQTWQMSYKYLLGCKPKLYFMNATIELEKRLSTSFTVLIISHILYLEYERFFLNMLKELPVVVVLKKHPAIKSDEVYIKLQKEYGFIYLTGQTYPRVDYVISYESTLAYEYMSCNIPVDIYKTEGQIDYNDYKTKILRMISDNNLV